MSGHDEIPSESHSSLHGVFSMGRAARAKTEHTIDGLEVVSEAGVGTTDLWATVRRLAAGVTVVSTLGEDGYLGITVSACCLVSLEPPRFLVALHTGSAVLEAVTTSQSFAVTVLSRRQELLAEMFAGRAPQPDARWSQHAHRTAVTGSPILSGGLAWLDCRLWQQMPVGDHTAIIGTVVAAGVTAGQDDPLLYFGSQYRGLTP